MNKIFSKQEKINRSESEIFNFLCNPSNFPFFLHEVKSANWINDSQLQVAKKYEETRLILGMPVKAIVEISQFVPDKTVAYLSKASGVTGEYVYNLSPSFEGCFVSLDAYVKTEGFLAKLMTPFFVMSMKKRDEHQLTYLREYFEKSQSFF
jgi:hypothetical protein